MTRSRFVYPQTETLTLDNGDTLTVRRRLNMGESRASYHACYEPFERADGSVVFVLHPTRLPIAKVAGFLIDWHLQAAPSIQGLDLYQRIAVLDNMDPADFFELKAAVDAHEARQMAARIEEKKRDATPNVVPISRLPSEPVGASSGSES